MAVVISKIAHHRGAPRIWIEGARLLKYGFEPSTPFQIEPSKGGFKLLANATSPERKVRTVSARSRRGKLVPIIDWNNSEILDVFQGMESVRIMFSHGVIFVLPLASEERRVEREMRLLTLLRSGQPLPCGSLSHGAGILDYAIHEGFKKAGVATHLAWANDISGELTEHASINNPIWGESTLELVAPMQELAYDELVLSNLPSISVLVAGIPCNGASVSGRAKNQTACAEQHEAVGHLIAPFLALVGRTNPAVIIVENVVPYASSASMWIMRHQLRDFGYTVHETILDAQEWNVLENRRRMCMIAISKGLSLDLGRLQKPEKLARQLGEVLEHIPQGDSRWSPMTGLVAKEQRDKANGKGFAMQICDAQSTKVPVIGEGYAKVRSTEVKIKSPYNDGLLRQVTLQEHADIKSIPRQLLGDVTALTFGHGLMGQSVTPPPFIAVGELVGVAMQDFVSTQTVH